MDVPGQVIVFALVDHAQVMVVQHHIAKINHPVSVGLGLLLVIEDRDRVRGRGTIVGQQGDFIDHEHGHWNIALGVQERVYRGRGYHEPDSGGAQRQGNPGQHQVRQEKPKLGKYRR